MKRTWTIVFCLAIFAAAAAIPITASAQEPLSVADTQRQGFMIEGILPLQVTISGADPDLPILGTDVPFGLIGFRLPRVALGLGGSFSRFVVQQYAEDARGSDSYNFVLFTPRAEIVLVQGPQAMAEAYLALGFSCGFSLQGTYVSNGDSDYESDTSFVMGAHAGFGGRYFFGGGPFGMGLEFGWSGLFYRMTGEVMGDPYTAWYNFHSLYAAITGQFVF